MSLQTSKVSSTLTPIEISGKISPVSAYNINGKNYYKLRDIGYSMSGSAKGFNITWDTIQKKIDLTSDAPYEPIGGEAVYHRTESEIALLRFLTIYLDDFPYEIKSYNINGSN